MKKPVLFFLLILAIFFSYNAFSYNYFSVLNENFTNNSIGFTKYNLTNYKCNVTNYDYNYGPGYVNGSYFCGETSQNLKSNLDRCLVFGALNKGSPYPIDYGLMYACKGGQFFGLKKVPPVLLFNKTYNQNFRSFENLTLWCDIPNDYSIGTNDATLNMTINGLPVNFGLGLGYSDYYTRPCSLMAIDYFFNRNNQGNGVGSCTKINTPYIYDQHIPNDALNRCYRQTNGVNLTYPFTLNNIRIYGLRSLSTSSLFYDTKIQYLKIYGNVTNSSAVIPFSENKLPDYNITYLNNPQCWAGPEDYNVFNYTLDVYDPENDTIYYSFNNAIENNISEFVYYDKYGIILFNRNKDFTFLDNTYNDGSYCDVERGPDWNGSKHNILLYMTDQQVVFNRELYMLSLNPSCVKDPEYIYRFNKPLDRLRYYTQFYGLDVSKINITLYDYALNPIFKYRLQSNYTDDSLYLFYYNNTDKIKVAEQPLSHSLTIHKLIFYNNGTAKIGASVNNSEDNPPFQYYNIENVPIAANIQYIGLDIESGNILQNYFSYLGSEFNPVFTTDKPNNFTSNSPGSNLVRFFITDSAHIDNKTYKTGLLNFVNKEGQYCIDRDQGPDNQENYFYGQNGGDSCSLETDGSLLSSLGLIFKLPYLMLCIGNLNYLAGYIGIAILIFCLAWFMIRGQITTFKQGSIFSFIIGTILLFMNFLIIPVYLLVALIFTFSMASSFITGE